MTFQAQTKAAPGSTPPLPPENGAQVNSATQTPATPVESVSVTFAGAGMPPVPPVPVAEPSEPAVILQFGQQACWRQSRPGIFSGPVIEQHVIKDISTGKDVRVFDGDAALHFGSIGERDMRLVRHDDGSLRLPDEPRYYREKVTLAPGDVIRTRGEFTGDYQLTGLYLVVRRANGAETAFRIPHENAASIDKYLDIKYEY